MSWVCAEDTVSFPLPLVGFPSSGSVPEEFRWEPSGLAGLLPDRYRPLSFANKSTLLYWKFLLSCLATCPTQLQTLTNVKKKLAICQARFSFFPAHRDPCLSSLFNFARPLNTFLVSSSPLPKEDQVLRLLLYARNQQIPLGKNWLNSINSLVPPPWNLGISSLGCLSSSPMPLSRCRLYYIRLALGWSSGLLESIVIYPEVQVFWDFIFY